jgi:hypothetical protein
VADVMRQHQPSWDRASRTAWPARCWQTRAAWKHCPNASGYIEGNARRREIDAVNGRSAGKILLFRDKRNR